MASDVRLFVDHPLGGGQSVPLDRGQANYLFNVMRLRVGDAVTVFNGQDGAWTAEVAEAGKRGGVLTCAALATPQGGVPDLWLLFAPLKKARTDFVVEKAVEMGVARILPVLTDFTNAERIRPDKMRARVIEAAEQCGATVLPAVAEMQKLSTLLDGWPTERQLVYADESQAGQAPARTDGLTAPGAVLIGPEGGFSAAERARLARLGQPLALGPRILRAETAVVAALTLWQVTVGDWGAA